MRRAEKDSAPQSAQTSAPPASSRIVVYAALAGNLAIAVTKLAAAGVTGSSAMFSEAVHSIVDTGNEGLLLHGYRQAARRPDPIHPLGYGRELYFWSFIVALLLFGLGAGVSLYQGTVHVLAPQPVEHATVSYVVLGLAFLFEGASWMVGWRAFNKSRGSLGFWAAFKASKDPPGFMVLFEDSAALLGIVIAVLGIFAAEHFDAPVLDGVASILIGLVLAVTAILLAIESKSLLIGERAAPHLVRSIETVAANEPGVVSANGAITVQLSPDQVLVALSIEFEDLLTADEIERCVASIERRVRNQHPEVNALFVKPQSSAGYANARRLRFGEAIGDS
ncbi:MAG: Cation efflux protein [Sphingomonas sp.]|jgi:cation diffusion facilitator family transporter|nr:Cation efflux protein [Sphingomonas sp.]